jgi:DNA-directed RNA polymerase subunit RPC12/RpoP
MVYRCVNCGKEIAGFNCDCQRDNAIWDSGLRKNQNKILNKKKI